MTQHTLTPWQIIENMAPYNARIDIYPTNAKEGTPLDDIRICRIKLRIAPTNGELQARGVLNDAIKQAEANAEFIVQACNAHDDLVAALEDMLQREINSLLDFNSTEEEIEEMPHIKASRAALAKAGVQS